MQNLTHTDYKILKYIKRFDTVSKSQIIKRFPKIEVIDYRLSVLQHELHFIYRKTRTSVTSSGRPTTAYTDDYSITESGKKALQDYEVHCKFYKRNLWLKNFWIPIIVSCITTLLLNSLLQKLPLILKWLVHNLQNLP